MNRIIRALFTLFILTLLFTQPSYAEDEPVDPGEPPPPACDPITNFNWVESATQTTGTLTLSWTPPTRFNVSSYKISYFKDGINSCPAETSAQLCGNLILEPTQPQNVSITGLAPSQRYRLTIRTYASTTPNYPNCGGLSSEVGGRLFIDAGPFYNLIPTYCGDNVKGRAEMCDGTDFGGNTCATSGSFEGGDLTCSSTSNCLQATTDNCTACNRLVREGTSANTNVSTASANYNPKVTTVGSNFKCFVRAEHQGSCVSCRITNGYTALGGNVTLSESCRFTRWNGNTAEFDCQAPSTPYQFLAVSSIYPSRNDGMSSGNATCGTCAASPGGYAHITTVLPENQAPTVTVQEQFDSPTDYKNPKVVVKCDDYIPGRNDSSGCNQSSYRLKRFDTRPNGCPTNYADYTLPSPQYTSRTTVWYCGAARDNLGNTNFSDQPYEFRPGCRDQCSPQGVEACKNTIPFISGREYSSFCGNFDSDACLEMSPNGDICPPWACDTGHCKSSSGDRQTGHAGVWHDLNENGQRDSGEEGIPNVPILTEKTDSNGAVMWRGDRNQLTTIVPPNLTGWEVVSRICQYDQAVSQTYCQNQTTTTVNLLNRDGNCPISSTPDETYAATGAGFPNPSTYSCGYGIAFGYKKVDQTNPGITLENASPASPTTSQAVTLSASATDNAGLSNIEIYVDGIMVQRCQLALRPTDTVRSGECQVSRFFSSGTHNYYAIATDNVGHRTRADGTFQVTAVISSDCPAGNQVQNGLISTPGGVSGEFGNTTQQCVLAPRAAFISYKIPSYDDLLKNHFKQAKESASPLISKLEIEGDATKNDLTFNQKQLIHIKGNLSLGGNPPSSASGPGVVFVDGNLNISQDYTYGRYSQRDSEGSIFIVKGDVSIEPNVGAIDGVIIAQGYIYTSGYGCEVSTTAVTKPLVVTGSLISIDSNKPIKFCRFLDPNPNRLPSEKINQQPKYLSILRDLFSSSIQKWAEIPGFTRIQSGRAPEAPGEEITVHTCYPTINGSERLGILSGNVVRSMPVYPGNSYALSGIMPGENSFDLYNGTTKLATLKQGEYYIWNVPNVPVGSQIEFSIKSGAKSCDGRAEVKARTNVNSYCTNENIRESGNVTGRVFKDNNFDPNSWPINKVYREVCENPVTPTPGPEACTSPTEKSDTCCGTTNVKNEISCIKTDACLPDPTLTGVTLDKVAGSVVILNEGLCGYSFAREITNTPDFTFSSVPAQISNGEQGNRNRVFSPNYGLKVIPPTGSTFTRGYCYPSANGRVDAYTRLSILSGGVNAPACSSGTDRANTFYGYFGFNTRTTPQLDALTPTKACFSSRYALNIAWTGEPLPNNDPSCAYGFWVDISQDPNFVGLGDGVSGYVHKCVRDATTTTAPEGFRGRDNTQFNFQKDKPYHVRVNNGSNSNILTFTTPNDQCAPEMRAFVTSTSYYGNLGGLVGADRQCQSLADNAGLTGSWKAWLSSNTESVASRFHYPPNTSFTTINDDPLASSWADLTDGSIITGLSSDENGRFANRPNIWTNTKSDGSSNGSSCNNWASSSRNDLAGHGFTTSTSSTWTDSGTVTSCDRDNHLYCFEQSRQPTVLTIDSTPACFSSSFNINLSWTGNPLPTNDPTNCPYGYWVNLSENQSFDHLYNGVDGYVQKCVQSGTDTIAPDGFTGANNATLTLSPGKRYWVRVFNGKPSNTESFTTPSNACTPLPKPNGVWKFNEGEGTTEKDISGNYLNGRSSNTAWSTENIGGRTRKSLVFNGTDSVVSVPDTNNLLSFTRNFTLSAWVKLSQLNKDQIIISKGQCGGSYIEYQLGIGSNNRPYMLFSQNSSQNQIVTGSTVLNADTWYLITGTYDGTTEKIYVNNQLAGSFATTLSSFTSASNLTFGARDATAACNSGNTLQELAGKLHSVRLYNQTLNQQQIQDLFTIDSENLPEKKVFLSYFGFQPSRRGIEAADYACQTAAINKVSGTYKAWISDSSTSAASRLTHHRGAYVLLDGTLIADNWDNMVKRETLYNPIDITAAGEYKPEGYIVRTNTNPSGTITSTDRNLNCQDFTSTAASLTSSVGHSSFSNNEWTSYQTNWICSGYQSLYCFEQ